MKQKYLGLSIKLKIKEYIKTKTTLFFFKIPFLRHLYIFIHFLASMKFTCSAALQ